MIIYRIKRIFWFIELIPKLGVINVFHVLYYRMLLRSGLLARKYPVIHTEINTLIYHSCQWRSDYPTDWKQDLIKQADRINRGFLPYYSCHWVNQSAPPDWFINPFNGSKCRQTELHWTKISDFSNDLGDIKNVWEASRFTWIGILARAFVISGEHKYLDTINEWLIDWLKQNPVNQGPNWKCGQEASIRVVNLLSAAYILDQSEKPTDILAKVIRHHLRRISSNIGYAVSQKNNHATSEAAALFIGGNWLMVVDDSNAKENRSYAEKGRKLLESMVRKLVYSDGSFAQHSVNYHRLFLDTLSYIILWMDKLNLQPLSNGFNEIAKKSLSWLLSIADESGRCPNIGSNDGTLLQTNHSCDYRDYRPSLQLATVLINNELTFESGPWDEALYWFGISRNNFSLSPVKKKSLFHSAGYIVMKGENSWAMLRYPYYRFRPSHNDVFHFDLWSKGRNLLFDSGSFSYNPDKDCEAPDLKSVHAHNTVSFDNTEQMPRLGRFLLAKWIKPLTLDNFELVGDMAGSWKGSYRDASRNIHHREIRWDRNMWEIRDKFSGKSKLVSVGYNFSGGKYSLDNNNNSLQLSWGEILVSANANLKVRNHSFSDYYMKLSRAYRLVAQTDNNSEVVTKINIFK